MPASAQVVRPVLGRIRHRLANQRVRGEVEDGLDVAFGQHAGGLVTDRGADERRVVRYRVLVAGGQVVEHRHVMPGREQVHGDYAADIPGAAGNQEPHPVALPSASPVFPGRPRLRKR